MTTWFISRHPGALHWMQQHGPAFDVHAEHLDVARIGAGDTVIGTLPVNLAAAVCERGAAYLHLSLRLPSHARGHELSANELRSLGAVLQRYEVRLIEGEIT